MNMANGEWVTFARVTARVRTCVVTLDQKSATCVSVRNARSEKKEVRVGGIRYSLCWRERT